MNQKKKYCKPYLFALYFLIGVLACVQYGCQTEFDKYYEKPENLAGPIYQQLAADTTFSEFVKAIDKLPAFKKAINTSGLYTVFAPTNAAVKKYLQEKYGRTSFEGFNMSEPKDSIAIQNFVDTHFALDMYFEYNFNEAVNDNRNMTNDKFRYYVRFREPIYDYFDKSVNRVRKVRPNNKMASVFMNKYLAKYNMTSDYEALYGRVPGDFNVEGARVLTDKRDIAAINGVIHGIDRVLEPKKNLIDIQQDINPIFHQMQEFNISLGYNESATMSEGRSGDRLDSLFTRYGFFNMSYYSENNMFTFFNPPREAYADYINNTVLPGFDPKYKNIDSVHFFTRLYLTDSYMSTRAVWSSDLKQGVVTMWGDTIVNPKYSKATTASNGIVYMLEDLNLPGAFTSVARGFMLNSDYSWYYDLVIGLTVSGRSFNVNPINIFYLQNKKKKFTIFVPSSNALKNIDGYNITRELAFNGTFKAYEYRKGGRRIQPRQRDTLVSYTIIPDIVIGSNEVASITNKWYETRIGSYIQIKNGKLNGNIPLDNYEETENGIIYYLDGDLMPVRPAFTVAELIKNNFPEFYQIIKARKVEEEDGQSDDQTLEAFLKMNSEMFTIFIPTTAALEAFKTAKGWGKYDEDKRWGQIAKYLITKTRVYSDGTFKQDEASLNPDPDDHSKFVSVYKDVVYLDPAGQDEYSYFQVTYPSGNMVVTSKDGQAATVVETSYKGTNVFDMEANNGVVHVIDKVLVPLLDDQQFPDK